METALQKATRAYLQAVLDHAGWEHPTEIARRIGVRPSTINRFFYNKKVKHNLSLKTLAKIADVSGLPIPPEILRFSAGAKGGMKSDADLSRAVAIPEGRRDLPVRNHRREMIEVPEVDPNAMAGDGGSVEVMAERVQEHQIGTYGFPAESFRDLFGAQYDKVVIIPVKGDSMMPTFLPGQRVLVDLSDRTPSPPGIFVLWDGLGTLIKRVEYIPFSDPGRVRIISDNPKHQPYERLLDEAHIQGRVVGAWERR